MAKDAVTGPKDEPRFSDTGAPDVGVDPTEAAKYASLVGNHKVGTSTERGDLTGKARWEGMAWTDTDAPYVQWVYRGGVWVAMAGAVYASGTRTASVALPSGTGYRCQGYTAVSSGVTITPASGRMTCVVPGRYRLALRGQWESNPNGERWAGITINGASLATEQRRSIIPGQALELHSQSIEDEVVLNVNDYVEFWFLHNVGAAIGIRNYRATMTLIGPA